MASNLPAWDLCYHIKSFPNLAYQEALIYCGRSALETCAYEPTLGFDWQTEGVILHRRLTDLDWDVLPLFREIAEIWIVLKPEVQVEANGVVL